MKACWEKPVLCDFHGDTFTNEQLAAEITKFDLVFSALGIKKGDKIALCAKNVARGPYPFFR